MDPSREFRVASTPSTPPRPLPLTDILRARGPDGYYIEGVFDYWGGSPSDLELARVSAQCG